MNSMGAMNQKKRTNTKRKNVINDSMRGEINSKMEMEETKSTISPVAGSAHNLLMRKHTNEYQHNLEYLKNCRSNSFDVVYFDFMFDTSVESSHGIKVIKPIVSYDVMTNEHVKEALRVAKKRVVVKSNYGNLSIKELGFDIRRENQKRHFFYGVIDKV